MKNQYCNCSYIAAIEILFLSRLYKIRNGLILQNISQIQTIADKFDLKREDCIDSGYIYFQSFDTRLNSLIKVINFAILIKEFLTGSKDIFEFNIMVLKTNIEHLLITRKVNDYSLKIPEDNKVWILQENNPVILYNAQLSSVDHNIQELISVGPKYGQQNFLEKCQEDIMFRAELIQSIQKAVGDYHIGTIGILGKENTGKTACMKYLCRSNPKKYIYLCAHGVFEEPSYPFVMLLYEIKDHFFDLLSVKYQNKLESLLAQIQMTSMVSYKQIQFDILDLLRQLTDQELLILVCDNLDAWPLEAIQLLQSICLKLREEQLQLKVICCMVGIYYPIMLDEIVHFSEYRSDSMNRVTDEDSTTMVNSDFEIAANKNNFSAKEKLLAILPSQRVDIRRYKKFNILIQDGLNDSEKIIISIVQKFPYILNRDIIVNIFRDENLYEVIDYLIDYHFLLEIQDHFGNHLFCALNSRVYSVELNTPKNIYANIRDYFEKEISSKSFDIYSLYVLMQNKIYFYDAIESNLSQMLDLEFNLTVDYFSEHTKFSEHKSVVELWNIIYDKSRLELGAHLKYFDSFQISKKNIRFLLALSSYYFLILEYEKSLEINKEAIYLFNNDLNYKVYIDDIFLIQSRIYISKGMFREAIEYINIGLESLQKSSRKNLTYQFIYQKILCLFLGKEFHLAIELIEKYNFEEYFTLYGEIENYLKAELLVARMYFEIGEYTKMKSLLLEIQHIARYYELYNYDVSICCWIARSCFYLGEYSLGFSVIEHIEDCEEKLYFQSEGYYFRNEVEHALRSAMLALKLSLKKASERKNVGSRSFENTYQVQEGILFSCRGKKDPLLNCIQGFTSYLHTRYGNAEIARKILDRITHRPSQEFSPFQHTFYYFYYLLLKENFTGEDREDVLYLSYAISILQNESSKILSTKIRRRYIYNNYWNNLLALEGEQHNLLISSNAKSSAI